MSKKAAPPDLGPERLADWWDLAEEAPASLSSDILDAANEICGTSLLNVGKSAPLVLSWYRHYLTGRHVTRCCLPLTAPHVVDLGALVIDVHPKMRRWIGTQPEVPTLQSLYSNHYMKRHVGELAKLPAMKFLRGRIAPLIGNALQTELVARFLGLVFNWVVRVWLTVDHEGDADAIKGTLRRCAGKPRFLSGDEKTVARFLIRMGQALEKANDYANVIPPLERLLLGARPTVRSAFDDFDGRLIHDCLISPDLDERDHEVEPLRRVPLVPHVPSHAAGEMVSVRRVRKTNRMEKLPDVLPEDLALAQVDQHGRHLLLGKLHDEGLMIWERDAYEVEVRRRTFLVAFFADVGPEAMADIGTKKAATTASVHARRLIFECLRDISARVILPGVEMDLRIHLEPVLGKTARRLAWPFTLKELQELFGKGRYDDMVEMEKVASGYFFPRHRGKNNATEPSQTIETLAQKDYDLAMYIFLGPERTLPALLPYNPPARRRREGVRDLVRLVRLDRWPDRVELARGEGFAEASFNPHYSLVTDEDFRHGLIEDIIGRQLKSAVRDFQLELAGVLS